MRFSPRSPNRWKWLVFALPTAAFLVAGKLLNTAPPTNSAQTAPDAAPELRPRVYGRRTSEVKEAALVTALKQKTWFRSWRPAASDAATSPDEIRIEVPVLFFTDDLTIRVEAHQGKTRVNVASRSRVGRGDFGENRRHIAQFLRALDKELA